MAKIDEFKLYLEKIEYLNSAIAVLSWDMMVNIPKKAVEDRSNVIGYLSGELYKLTTSNEMLQFINYFENESNLDDVTLSMVENARREYNLTKKIPEDRYTEYTIASSNGEAAWENAKHNSEFELFRPSLEKLVNFKKEFIEYWGYGKNKYDTLLDFYEPGITVEKLDEIFGELRDAIVNLLNKIQASSEKVDDSFFKQYFKEEDQEKFGLFVLNKMGFDFNAGRLDVSIHPFTTEFGNKDVRITTSYDENDFRSSIFSCIHEGGHALYEQDIPDSLKGTMLGHGVSMGVHESQSRFYENVLGRSKEFWSYFYNEIQERFPQFKNVTLDEFYKGINTVRPSLIRVDADELTYSLHIIIRYEIEKALINDEIQVKDLPKIWNEKYKEYLDVEPKNDAEGVLQDMHWSDGSFGYFPSYALGNLYGAQFFNKMKRDIPDIYSEIQKGNLNVVHEWLKENIHKYGSIYKPSDLIKKVTGEDLTAKYFIQYLVEKYSKIYNL